MGDVLIALLPALIMSVYLFGFMSLVIVLVSVAACVLFEYLGCIVFKRKQTLLDLSAVVTGVLLAFNLPPTVPVWMPIVGAFFAIFIVKQIFGGLGSNFVNPALAARVFLLSWPQDMTNYTYPIYNPLGNIQVDAMSAATPLSFLKNGKLPDQSFFELLLGNRGGVIGETCAIVLLAGGAYLLIRKVITWHIPVAFIGTVALLTFIFPQAMPRLDFMIYEILSGGLILGAVFMATDYVTSPVTPSGKIIFGVGCGALTVFIRYFGGYPEGVSFAILIMNTLAFTIDKLTKRKKFGGGAVKNA